MTVALVLALHALGSFAFLPACDAADDPPRKSERKKSGKKPPGSEIFDHPTILNFQIQLAETNFQALRTNAREYTSVTVIVDGKEYRRVGLKLKGAAGSFRGIDDRPSISLNFDKWINDQRVFGLRRLHLNNSVQDESRLNEYIGSELFRAGGVPAARVAWATLSLNDRKLGLYVLIEAFETEFLRLFFGSDKGNLYEGGFVRDVDLDLAKDSGKGPDDLSDLRALRAAANEKDLTNRWEKLQQVMDVDLFTTYAALEVMVADWDGYPLNRNNYRIYFRPNDGRAVMMPHGMDQLFQRSNMEMDAGWNGVLAWSLFDTPQGQKLYEERCRQVFTNVFKLERITNLIAQATEVLATADPGIVSRAADLTDRVQRRYRNLRRDPLLKPPPPVATNAVPAQAPNP